MSAAELYEASALKPRRRRATASEMDERAQFYIRYAGEHGPVTVRQLYYRAGVEGVAGIDKTDGGYVKVQRQVLALRRAGRLPYRDIADASRWMRKPTTWNSVEEALRETAATYRKALWRDQGVNLEVWLEKNALAGVVYPVTAQYDVALMPTLGFTSETFAFEAIDAADPDHPLMIYALYDFDRAGQDACNSLQEKLERFAGERDVQVHFMCLAIEDQDIDLASFDPDTGMVYLQGAGWRELPTREPKRESKADRNWPHPFAIELDAIEPDDLRRLVRWAIEQHMPAEHLEILKVAEESERETIQGLVAAIAP
jgi:hypothetical protein